MLENLVYYYVTRMILLPLLLLQPLELILKLNQLLLENQRLNYKFGIQLDKKDFEQLQPLIIVEQWEYY